MISRKASLRLLFAIVIGCVASCSSTDPTTSGGPDFPLNDQPVDDGANLFEPAPVPTSEYISTLALIVEQGTESSKPVFVRVERSGEDFVLSGGDTTEALINQVESTALIVFLENDTSRIFHLEVSRATSSAFAVVNIGTMAAHIDYEGARFDVASEEPIDASIEFEPSLTQTPDCRENAQICTLTFSGTSGLLNSQSSAVYLHLIFRLGGFSDNSDPFIVQGPSIEIDPADESWNATIDIDRNDLDSMTAVQVAAIVTSTEVTTQQRPITSDIFDKLISVSNFFTVELNGLPISQGG